MRLARLIGWPYARKHVLRTCLTVAGIALGVAVFVAMHAANRAVLGGFERTVDRIAGAAQLQVTAGGFGFPEEVLERVQAVPEVRVAVPVIEAVVDTGLAGQGSLLILGVDMTGDRSLRQYDLESGEEAIIDDPLVFLAQPDSLIVTREFAERNRLEVGHRIPLMTMEGPKQFVVRGIMRPGGFGKAFGGNLAVMDIYAAQKMLGRGRRFDRIDVAVREGVPVERCQAALRAALGPGFEVEPPEARGAHFESMLRGYTFTVNISSLFALFIGMFIIYNSFQIAVTERRVEIGILRALGATQGQIRGLFLVESALLGATGAGLGVILGGAMAQLSAAYIGGLLEDVYGVAQHVEGAELGAPLIASSAALGVLASVLAAWIPSRAAARVDPVQALQKGKYQVLSVGENRARRRAAAASLAAALICLAAGRSAEAFYAGYLLAVLTAILLAPTLSLWLSKLLRPLLRWLRPVEGTLAADSLIHAPRRTSATVAALMLSLAMVIGFAGMAGAIYDSVTQWMDQVLNPDLFVNASGSISRRNFTFPASLAHEIERMEGVDQVQAVRHARVIFGGVPVSVVAADVEKLASKVRRIVIQGDLDEMYRLTAQGRGVIVSDNFADLRGVRLGDTIALPSPSGLVRLPVVGITRDYTDQQGSVLVDRSVYRRWWQEDSADVLRIYLKPGYSPERVRQRILEQFAARQRLFVLDNAEVRREILRLTDQWFGMTYNQIAVAVLVAVLGIVNTLTVSITDRRRELGVLQSVGGLRQQVRHTVWMEAVGIGLIGLVLGLALGAVNLYYTVEMVHRVAGLRIDYQYPWGVAALLVPGMLLVALASALWPAEKAVRGRLVEALEYE
ncbi:MAG: ABC transporter permease [Bryobacteraceae bacterium]|nr:ABC transporter permease [Bryobacteraceae bacterium]